MEFNEKLQQLRKSRGLTQEELAGQLYVSRAAVSKWESGRGYPGIDSLKAIAAFFDVTVDDLLSAGDLLTAAEDDVRRKEARQRDLVCGLLDCAAAALMFLPCFGQSAGDAVRSVPLFALSGGLLTAAFWAALAAVVVVGIATLAMQGVQHPLWLRCKAKLSLGVSALSTLLFIACRQPYAATLLFIFLAIKTLLHIKWR